MNNIKYTIYYMDGHSEVIYGDEIVMNECITIEVFLDEDGSNVRYIYLPYTSVQKLVEE